MVMSLFFTLGSTVQDWGWPKNDPFWTKNGQIWWGEVPSRFLVLLTSMIYDLKRWLSDLVLHSSLNDLVSFWKVELQSRMSTTRSFLCVFFKGFKYIVEVGSLRRAKDLSLLFVGVSWPPCCVLNFSQRFVTSPLDKQQSTRKLSKQIEWAGQPLKS